MKTLRTIGTMASLVALAVSLGAGVASASPLAPAAQCPWNPANDSRTTGEFTANGVRIHTGPSTSCATRGEGQRGQTFTGHCTAWGTNGTAPQYFIYLTDNATGVTGWADWDLVDAHPEVGPC